MSRVSPLADCTKDTLQSINRYAATSVSSSSTGYTKPVRIARHDPYASKLLAPEDSVEYNSILSSPLSSRHSPLNWEARAFDPTALYSSSRTTPYLGQSLASLTLDVQHHRSLFGDSPASYPTNVPAALPEAATAATTTTTTIASTTTRAASAGDSASLSARTTTSNSKTSATNTPPRRALGKVYVDGRPLVVSPHNNEVTVQLRSGEAAFVVMDMRQLLAREQDTRDFIGLPVIVEGDRGEDYGTVTALAHTEHISAAAGGEESGRKSPSARGASPAPAPAATTHHGALPRVLRVATATEQQQAETLPALEAEALDYCHTCLQEVHLSVPITVEGVVFQFDRKKLTVRYTSEAYVDFNELTRMLHKRFNCRIWMDQLNREAVAGGEKRIRRPEHSGQGKGRGSGNPRRAAPQRKRD